MMKRFVMGILMLSLCGCTYGVREFKGIVSDPHYAQYQAQLDDLESSYLKGSLTYPEYLERKKVIDDNYAKEVQQREEKIHQ